jgi:dipeptidyl aminopeptidase/acylaminoacyl peptidase
LTEAGQPSSTPKRPRLRPKRRHLLALVLAIPLLLHVVAREAVASAVAYAPNASEAGPTPGRLRIPEVLAKRGVSSLETRVGPPNATIESWVVEPRAAEPKGTIVLLHGARMDKRSLAPVAAALVDAGYRAALVDLRGHGESSGRYLSYGSVESHDVSAVLDSLSERASLGCVGVYGFSYGGAVAVRLGAVDPRVKVTVAVSPFATLREVVGDYRRKYLPQPLNAIPDAWFQSAVDEAARIASFDPDASSPLQAAARSHAKLLLIHGTADTQVPLRHSQMLLRAGDEDTRLIAVPRAGHEAMPSDPTGVIRKEAVAWFERWFARGSCAP